ncbi:hypothetical protein [Pseudoalteromonas sp.]|uniref:hypothetical protein n=1 Tax=Pseudoalteromonas sp. TaxID=53249 RepID=UPI0035617E42
MKWLIVVVLSSLLSSSYCFNEKRLLQAFSAYPIQLYATLAHFALLPDVDDFRDSTDHLRVYANFKNPDAEALLAEAFIENASLYQSTLLIAGKNGSTLAKRKLEDYLKSTNQWLAIRNLPWQLTEPLQTEVAMALRQPLGKTALQTSLIYPSTRCDEKVMLVVTDLNSFNHVTALKKRFEATFDLPVCFSEPVYFDATKISCSDNSKTRIHCVLTNNEVLASFSYDKLAFFSKQGIANAYANQLHMSYLQSERVLLHELMHLYGFIDEYPLKKALAQRVCNVDKTTRIAKNIVVLPNSNDAADRISFNGQDWFRANTCDNATGQAYKPVSVTSNLELLDLPLPNLYKIWLQQAMLKGNNL